MNTAGCRPIHPDGNRNRGIELREYIAVHILASLAEPFYLSCAQHWEATRSSRTTEAEIVAEEQKVRRRLIDETMLLTEALVDRLRPESGD